MEEKSLNVFRLIGDVLLKGKSAQIGDIRTWKGVKEQKTANGWVPVKEGGKTRKLIDPEKKRSKKEDEPKKDHSPEELLEFARNATDEQLNNHSKGGDEKMRVAAKQELDRREKEETPQDDKKIDVAGCKSLSKFVSLTS